MQKQKDSINIPLELVEQIRRSNAVLFTGTELSAVAGLPGWIDLVKLLTEEIEFDLPKNISHIRSSHLMDGIELYADRIGLNSLIRQMRKLLDTTKVPLTTVHALITELPIKEIYTTSYDNLIERAYATKGISFNKIVKDDELPYWDHQVCQIVKLFGDLEQPDSMIVTRTQVNSFSARRPQLITHVKTTLTNKTPLFLGYSLQDPFLDQIWDTIGYEIGAHRRRGYAVLSDCNPTVKSYFTKRSIHVINLDGISGDNNDEKFTYWVDRLLNML